MTGNSRVEEAARTIELLTGVPPGGRVPQRGKMSAKEKKEQADRIKRFLALPPQLQEGVLRYGEHIQVAYKLDKK